MIDGKEARLSGACTLSDSLVLFCASVEDTPDWTVDGPVLGSYFGVYSIRQNKIVDTYLLKDGQDRIIPEKIESLEITGRRNQYVDVIAIADNDNGTSKLFMLTLNLSKRFK